MRNTEEKNKRHLLVKPNLVPPSHSSRVQPNAGAQTAAGPRRTPALAHRVPVCEERAPPKVQFKCALAEPFFFFFLNNMTKFPFDNVTVEQELHL